MPVTQTRAQSWFHQQFWPEVRNTHILQGKPQEWSRLQVWNGNALEPALPKDIQGMPNDEQIENLYDKVKQGKVFLFPLGSNVPDKVGDKTILYPLPLDMSEPVPPAPLTQENPTTTERSAHARATSRYNQDLDRYNQVQAVLKEFGPGIQDAVDSYNAGRDMEQEGKEIEVRRSNSIKQTILRNMDRADRILSTVLAPQPSAPADIYYVQGIPNPAMGTFRYDHFNNILEPNAYDLPADDKLTNDEAATINFAMLGVKSEMAKVLYDTMPSYGPLQSAGRAQEGFHTLLTGMFGDIRHDQALEYCTGRAMQLGKEAIDAYLNQNDPTLLGKRLGECARNIKVTFTGMSQKKITQEMVAATKLTERVLNLLDKDEALLEASGLDEKELESLRGYVQMGAIYRNHVVGSMKLNEAQIKGIPLSTEEKTQILVNAVIRRMVEKELEKDNALAEADPEHKRGLEEAEEEDQRVDDAYRVWINENKVYEKDNETQTKLKNAYNKKHDLGQRVQLYNVKDLEHDALRILGQPGALDRLREKLLKDPEIKKAAAKEPMEITANMLDKSSQLDALVEKNPTLLKEVAVSDEQKQAWFENMKDLVSFTEDPNVQSPWISAGVSTDMSRLRIAVPNAQGGKDLVELGSLLEGGLRDLENPTEKALNLMYINAREGNLYYYQAGKDMPMRIGAEGTLASAQQLKEPVQPSGWQKFWNLVTGGRAYASICNPAPDRDPAAMEKILQAKESRAAVRQSELANHSRVQRELANPEARERDFENARLNTEVENFRHIPDPNKPQQFPNYNRDNVLDKVQQEAMNALGTPTGSALFTAFSRYVQPTLCNVEPSQKMLRQAMASMVLAEAVREEQLANNGNTFASQLDSNYEGMLQGVMDDAVFQAFTQNPSKEMLAHFLMADGAKNMYRAMKDMAQKRSDQQPEDHQDPLEMNKKVENEGMQVGNMG